MALGTDHLANSAASVQEFIPEIWSNDVIAAYKTNLVVANLVSRINHNNKRGDTINIPKPSRGSAADKVVGSQVTLNQNNSSEVSVTINKWKEYSSMLEDLIDKQALPSLRRFITEDAGFQIAKAIDSDLIALWEGLQGGTVGAGTYAAAVIGGDGSTLFDPTANTNTGNGSAITDAGIRKMIQTLDDADVPMDGRALVIPPVAKSTLMGLSRFTEQSFTGESGSGNIIRTGVLGDIYGIPVYVSTNCPTVTATDTSTTYRAGCMFHKDALVFAEQQGVRSQMQYKQEYLGDLLTVDTIYGIAELRNDAGVTFVIPS